MNAIKTGSNCRAASKRFTAHLGNYRIKSASGISSQADPVQARSYVESAQSALIAQRSLLRQNQQRLTVLLGFDSMGKSWTIPENLVEVSDLYKEPDFNVIPNMLAAQAEVEVAKADKKNRFKPLSYAFFGRFGESGSQWHQSK